jgi:hypothetical protein
MFSLDIPVSYLDKDKGISMRNTLIIFFNEKIDNLEVKRLVIEGINDLSDKSVTSLTYIFYTIQQTE